MIFWAKLFEKQILLFFIFFILTAWGLTASTYAILKKDRTLLIQMNGFETSVIDGETHIPAEIENYLNHFVGIFYSYTSVNFEKHIDQSMFFLTEDVALKFAPKLNEKFKKVAKTPTFQAAMVTSINRIKDLDYEIEINVVRRVNGEESEEKYRVRLSLIKAQRNLKNPYGLLIANLKEIYD